MPYIMIWDNGNGEYQAPIAEFVSSVSNKDLEPSAFYLLPIDICEQAKP
jgi:hypothetical protein